MNGRRGFEKSAPPSAGTRWPKVCSVNPVAQVVAVMGRGVVPPKTPLMLADDLASVPKSGHLAGQRHVQWHEREYSSQTIWQDETPNVVRRPADDSPTVMFPAVGSWTTPVPMWEVVGA